MVIIPKHAHTSRKYNLDEENNIFLRNKYYEIYVIKSSNNENVTKQISKQTFFDRQSNPIKIVRLVSFPWSFEIVKLICVLPEL